MSTQTSTETEQLEPITMQVNELADREWFEERGAKSFLMRFYTVFGIPEEVAGEVLQYLPQRLYFAGQPIRIRCGWMWEMPMKRFTARATVQRDGMPLIQMKLDEERLPKSLYIVLTTPIYQAGNVEYGSWHLDRVVALLRTYCGRALLKDCIYQQEMWPHGDWATAGHNKVDGGGFADGPRPHPSNFRMIELLLSRLDKVDEPTRKRVNVALSYLNRGHQDSDFFSYWLCMEILSGGGSNVVRSKLQKAYNLRTQQAADSQLGFSRIKGWRHDLVHDGIRPFLTQDLERYVQLLILDLLEQVLGFPPSRHAGAMQRQPGVNLSPLALPDNRSESQKQRDASYWSEPGPQVTEEDRAKIVSAAIERWKRVVDEWSRWHPPDVDGSNLS